MQETELLRSLEEKLLNPTFRRSGAAVSELLAEDFREFGSSGRTYTKAEIIDHLQQEIYTQIALSNFEVKWIAPEGALLTYRSTRPGEPGQPASTALRSSFWIRREGHWQMLFHQGTRIPVQAERAG